MRNEFNFSCSLLVHLDCKNFINICFWIFLCVRSYDVSAYTEMYIGNVLDDILGFWLFLLFFTRINSER